MVIRCQKWGWAGLAEQGPQWSLWGDCIHSLSKKLIVSCFSSCLEGWQRGASDNGEDREIGQCVLMEEKH